MLEMAEIVLSADSIGHTDLEMADNCIDIVLTAQYIYRFIVIPFLKDYPFVCLKDF